MDATWQGRLLDIFHSQKKVFLSGITRDNPFKKAQLTKLRHALLLHKEAVCEAMWSDLGRSHHAVEQAELAPLLNEISFALEHLDEWSIEKKCRPRPCSATAKVTSRVRATGLTTLSGRLTTRST
ncbi:hypothetical protein VRC35_22320 [Erwinia aphidicola]|uniref:hypothetical protein n=1 Tax=Erwinia aphidicola TaxID=68334 RepID=UPI0030CDDAED